RLQQEFGTAVILITHDLGVIADVADDVVVMYGGMVMEHADRVTTFKNFHHPYTEGLLQSLPAYAPERHPLPPIPAPPTSPPPPPPRGSAWLPVRRPVPLRHGPVSRGGAAARGSRRGARSHVGVLAAAEFRRAAGAARQAGSDAAGQRRSVRERDDSRDARHYR